MIQYIGVVHPKTIVIDIYSTLFFFDYNWGTFRIYDFNFDLIFLFLFVAKDIRQQIQVTKGLPCI